MQSIRGKRPLTEKPKAPNVIVRTKQDPSSLEIALLKFQTELHETAVNSGWWEDVPEIGTSLALIHSEISEALEGARTGAKDKHLPQFANIEVELADAIIRILDMAEGRRLRVVAALIAKAEYNKSRSYRHGGKAF